MVSKWEGSPDREFAFVTLEILQPIKYNLLEGEDQLYTFPISVAITLEPCEDFVQSSPRSVHRHLVILKGYQGQGVAQ